MWPLALGPRGVRDNVGYSHQLSSFTLGFDLPLIRQVLPNNIKQLLFFVVFETDIRLQHPVNPSLEGRELVSYIFCSVHVTFVCVVSFLPGLESLRGDQVHGRDLEKLRRTARLMQHLEPLSGLGDQRPATGSDGRTSRIPGNETTPATLARMNQPGSGGT